MFFERSLFCVHVHSIVQNNPKSLMAHFTIEGPFIPVCTENTKLYTFNFNYLDKFDFWCKNTYISNLVLNFTLTKYQLIDFGQILYGKRFSLLFCIYFW